MTNPDWGSTDSGVTMNQIRPFIRLRGRSIMALVLTPEPPLPEWLAALDAQIERSPNFFDGRSVIMDLGTLPRETEDVAGLLRDIADRGIHIIGTEGAHRSWRGLEAWGRPMPPAAANASRPIEIPQPPPPAAAREPVSPPPPAHAEAPPESRSVLINHSLRSGQSVANESGDVTVLGSVASGAEVVAGGSIHIYGALRGRAIAGLTGHPGARIFCRKFHAELVAIDGVYQTAEDMPTDRVGAPACAWLDGDIMRITAID